jgi:hypothetical protein
VWIKSTKFFPDSDKTSEQAKTSSKLWSQVHTTNSTGKRTLNIELSDDEIYVLEDPSNSIPPSNMQPFFTSLCTQINPLLPVNDGYARDMHSGISRFSLRPRHRPSGLGFPLFSTVNPGKRQHGSGFECRYGQDIFTKKYSMALGPNSLLSTRTGNPSRGLQRTGREINPSPRSSAEVNS